MALGHRPISFFLAPKQDPSTWNNCASASYPAIATDHLRLPPVDLSNGFIMNLTLEAIIR